MMGLHKCPRCELNYIRDDEKVCNVCRRDMKGVPDADEQALCIECGENPVVNGRDLCAYCLRELRRREKLDKLMEHAQEPDELTEIDVDELDEIDVPVTGDIPSEELQEIHREFGDEDDELNSGGDDEDDQEEEDI